MYEALREFEDKYFIQDDRCYSAILEEAEAEEYDSDQELQQQYDAIIGVYYLQQEEQVQHDQPFYEA